MLNFFQYDMICGNAIVKIQEMLHRKRNISSDCVVLIAERIKPRIAKIGYALRKKGYQVILFVRDVYGEEIARANVRFFDRACLFHDEKDLYCKALMIKPLVYHLFTEAVVGEWAQYIVRKKDKLGKVVYDQYDVYRGLYRFHNRNWEIREKYCFENADGLCCRSFESQLLKKRFHYRFHGRRILFFDYCWNRYHVSKRKKEPEESLQIVYGGRILSPRSKDVFGQIEWEGLNCIVRCLAQKDGYLTVIPFERTEEHDDFLKLAENSRHFEITEPMRFRELIKRESQMDYGIDCLELQNKGEEYRQIFTGVTDYKAKTRYYATNKFFDYLDAGIPILYGREGEMFGRYFERFGAAVFCAIEHMPETLDALKRERNRYSENVKAAREMLSIERQIDRLLAFYKSL